MTKYIVNISQLIISMQHPTMTVEEDVSNTNSMILAEIKNMGGDIGASLIAW